MLSGQEFWAGIIFLCVPSLVYLLRDCIDEASRDDSYSKAWHWGEKSRRSNNVEVWFPHEIGLIIACLSDIAILRALLT